MHVEEQAAAPEQPGSEEAPADLSLLRVGDTLRVAGYLTEIVRNDGERVLLKPIGWRHNGRTEVHQVQHGGRTYPLFVGRYSIVIHLR